MGTERYARAAPSPLKLPQEESRGAHLLAPSSCTKVQGRCQEAMGGWQGRASGRTGAGREESNHSEGCTDGEEAYIPHNAGPWLEKALL